MSLAKKTIGCAIVLLGGFFLVGGCVTAMVALSSQDDESPSARTVDSPTAATAPALPSHNDYANKVQNIVLDGLWLPETGRPSAFVEMCDTTVVWACAIASIESDSAGSIEITLQPENIWIDKWDGSTDWYDFGEYVARGVYNFTRSTIAPPLTRIDVLTSTGDIAYLGNY